MRPAVVFTMLAAAVASGMPAIAHHSNPFYFDMSSAMTLQGVVLRVRWVNPHIVLDLQTRSEKGAAETWIVQGSSPSNAVRQTGMKERLRPGIAVTVRVFPSRIALFVNDEDTVLAARPGNDRQSSRIVGGGQIRFANGDVMAFGGGPKF